MIIHLNYDNGETYQCVSLAQAKFILKNKLDEKLTLVGIKLKSDHEKDGNVHINLDRYIENVTNSVKGG